MTHHSKLISTMATLAILLLFQKPACAQQKTVNIYSWSDHFDPKVLEDFTKETGIKVVYDAYDSIETMESKLLLGKSGYDIAVVSTTSLHRLSTAGALIPVDRAKLPNHKNLWPEIMDRLKIHDPGNRFAVPHFWGTFGFGVNVVKVKALLGSNIPETWDLLLDPKYSNKLKECGIYVLDDLEEVLPNVLRVLKLDPNSKNQNDIQKAGEIVSRIRGNVRKFHSSEYINSLASGEACLALGLSGDMMQARRRAIVSNNGVEIAYILPREGSKVWVDSIVIPQGTPNPDYALTFINYMLRADIAAANSNYVESANAIVSSRSMIRQELLNNTNIFPREDMMKRIFTSIVFDDKSKPTLSRLWLRIKTGK